MSYIMCCHMHLFSRRYSSARFFCDCLLRPALLFFSPPPPPPPAAPPAGDPSVGDLIPGAGPEHLSAPRWSQPSLLRDRHGVVGLLRWREPGEGRTGRDRQQCPGELL